MKYVTKFVVVTALVGLVAASCGSNGGGTTTGNSPGTTPKKGGVLNLAQLGDVTAAFDPQKEYYQVSFAYYQCCLLRTLLSYNGLDSAHDGNALQPDLATGLPETSSDGLTWTFHMKSGIHYAPPMQDVEITAPDIIRALEREFTPEVAAGYGFYYNVIEGSADFSSGKAKTVSGLSAPDPHTLVVKLTEPAGDLGFRFALPATAPIPPSPTDPSAVLGVATGHDDDYGRFLVSSGPYMFKGSEALDFSQPAKDQTPVAGYVPNKSYDIVRNPSWDASTDNLRPSYVDEITTQLGGENAVLDQKVEANEVDMVFDVSSPDPQFLQKFKTTPDLQNRIFINQTQGNYYATMNLGVPPFDDIHVRKAVNFAIDKDGYRRIGGGPDTGELAGHFLPDSLVNDQLKDYNPYATPGDKGADDPTGLESAKAEMKQATTYDTNGDGVCDAEACKNVLTVANNQPKSRQQAALMQQNLEAIGIQLNVKYFTQSAAYGKIFDPKNHIAFTTGWAGWLKDYPDAYTFFFPVMYGPNILDQYNTNYSMVGGTPDQMKKYGYAVTDVPSMDAQIEKCFPLTGDERVSCWADADKYLMEQIAPIVPVIFSNTVTIISDRVTNFTYSAYNDAPSLSQIGVSDAGGS
jgi:peptide/nickel transport system substrate-binding protein